jgi:hypothetical protein
LAGASSEVQPQRPEAASDSEAGIIIPLE